MRVIMKEVLDLILETMYAGDEEEEEEDESDKKYKDIKKTKKRNESEI